ncbi:DNA helicase RecD OS=Streptomyces fumanus OX=67302 GN=GCM10018772_46190 PE=4 SV=1 [Streptomyces fumanus]
MSTEPEPTEEATAAPEPATPGTTEGAGAPGGERGGATEAEAPGGGQDEATDAEATAGGEVPTEGDVPAGGEAPAEGEPPAGGDAAVESGTGADGDTAADGGVPGRGEAGGGTGKELSEAEAELLAQQLERERIERRKAEKKAPVAAGAKLSGTAAELLAAVRAVESGEKPPAAVFAEPRPAPRRPAPEPVRRPVPVPDRSAGAPPAPAPEAVQAVRAVLTAGGAPEALAPQVVAALGEGADEALRADPWHLLRVAGVRPEQADGFARALLGAECRPDDERRGRAVTVWLLEQAALAGLGRFVGGRHPELESPSSRPNPCAGRRSSGSNSPTVPSALDGAAVPRPGPRRRQPPPPAGPAQQPWGSATA